MNKRLLVTSTELMMVQFLIPHVTHLSQNGFEVEIACSNVGGRMDEVREKLRDHVKAIHEVRLVRSPTSPTNFKGYGDMRKVIENGNYDIIWTNEPVMGVVTRLAARDARKRGTKVIYMVHGFHFYKGAPALNWMLFYPMERFASRYCDEIVTINREDEARAKKMHAPSVKYIHGIGVNTGRLHSKDNQSSIRRELGLPDDAFLVLSIGELSKRKNQQVIIRALGKLKEEQIHYLICGKGVLLDELKQLSKDCGIEDHVHFLGYRNDVVDICSQSDIFALPSLHEGLSVASLEAMYCGLPIVISDIRGVRDYITDGKNGFICETMDIPAYERSVKTLFDDAELRRIMSEQNREDVIQYTLEHAEQEVLGLLQNEIGN